MRKKARGHHSNHYPPAVLATLPAHTVLLSTSISYSVSTGTSTSTTVLVLLHVLVQL
jgi:hypothetical protein